MAFLTKFEGLRLESSHNRASVAEEKPGSGEDESPSVSNDSLPFSGHQAAIKNAVVGIGAWFSDPLLAGPRCLVHEDFMTTESEDESSLAEDRNGVLVDEPLDAGSLKTVSDSGRPDICATAVATTPVNGLLDPSTIGSSCLTNAYKKLAVGDDQLHTAQQIVNCPWAIERRVPPQPNSRIRVPEVGPYSHIRDDAKALTALYYKGKTRYWGHAITEDENAIRGFKLLLLRDEDLQDDIQKSPYLENAKMKLKRLGTSPEKLWQTTFPCFGRTHIRMKQARGSGSIDGLPFKIILTVPTIWKPCAHQKMYNAASMAGILKHRECGKTTLNFISESEAAALAILNELQNSNSIKKGDICIVCDIAGGTTDLISYKVTDTDPLTLYESVEGKGNLGGGTFVDEIFQAHIMSPIGPEIWEKVSHSIKVKFMNDEWEFGIKRAFDGDADKNWTCQLPLDIVRHFRPHRKNDCRNAAQMGHG
ncbi:uncharacterized protein PV09_06118 [Verruconis gallopava]|uniref:Uncharacterized protein n=1 Tax=Verruconis gallopava TaxID=253628 RepID=A0A0D1XK25_9PEZI|nr:uncharacterized protein PV09_06118 [Verruconis gallopava]KIW02681.1 hypothetical protein PV09_06118 [Verruconis gallopava]